MSNEKKFTNTVTIPLSEYDQLRKIKEADGIYIWTCHYCVYGIDKVEKTLSSSLIELEKKYNELNGDFHKLKEEKLCLENVIHNMKQPKKKNKKWFLNIFK